MASSIFILFFSLTLPPLKYEEIVARPSLVRLAISFIVAAVRSVSRYTISVLLFLFCFSVTSANFHSSHYKFFHCCNCSLAICLRIKYRFFSRSLFHCLGVCRTKFRDKVYFADSTLYTIHNIFIDESGCAMKNQRNIYIFTNFTRRSLSRTGVPT